MLAVLTGVVSGDIPDKLACLIIWTRFDDTLAVTLAAMRTQQDVLNKVNPLCIDKPLRPINREARRARRSVALRIISQHLVAAAIAYSIWVVPTSYGFRRLFMNA